MPQHYIMSPLETASNLFRNTLGMNLHRLLYTAKEADAALIVPVFLPGTRQRANFHGYANDYLSSVQSVAKQHYVPPLEIKIAKWLADVSLADNEIPAPNANEQVLYVQGHGAPGQQDISDDDGSRADIADIVAALDAINAKNSAIALKINACFSGAGQKIKFRDAAALSDWIDQRQRGVKGAFAMFEPENSLSATLRRKLARHPGIIYGYIGPTTIANSPYMPSPSGKFTYDPHMAVELRYANGSTSVGVCVRKRLTRIGFAPIQSDF
jgi:hypothetical protein